MTTTTEITYEVQKRPAGSTGEYELHVDRLGMFVPEEGEPAIFYAFDDAYACAARLRPEFEARVQEVETTRRVAAYYY